MTTPSQLQPTSAEGKTTGPDGGHKQTPDGRERAWKLVSTLSGLLGGLLARKLLRKVYEVVRKDPGAPSPFDPTSDEFSWPDVVLWAVAAGIGLGVAKVVSARIAVLSWETITGRAPPGSSTERA